MVPTFVVLRQTGAWTYGALLSQTWSFAGDDGRQDVSASVLQPFLAYVAPTKTTISLNAESAYDWENESWSAPIVFMAKQLVLVARQPVQLVAGVRFYWADAPENGPGS